MNQIWYYVYILFSLKDGKLYIGYTKDLKNRVKNHNEGLNTSTKCRRPLILIFAESFINEKDVRRREIFYKSGRGREMVKKELKNTFEKLNKI